MSSKSTNSKKSPEPKETPDSEVDQGIAKREEIIEEIISEHPEIKTVITTDVEGEPLVKNPQEKKAEKPQKDKKKNKQD
jgi:hypothetical protein